jgi:hypothetical protein
LEEVKDYLARVDAWNPNHYLEAKVSKKNITFYNIGWYYVLDGSRQHISMLFIHI